MAWWSSARSAGRRRRIGEGAVEATAWRSQDGEAWTRLDLPTEIATAGGVAVASGAIGFVISTASEVWYSADVESWQLVHEAADGVAFRQPTAGDEGFVVSALDTDADRSLVFASGDGLTWYEADAPGMPFSIAPFGGDWLTVAFTDDASTIAVFRSANGLDWSATADVNDLTGPDGPKAGEGPKSEITEALVSGEGRVAVLTLGWNHCCARPSAGVQVHVSTDGDTWQQPGLPETAYVTATATDGEVVVIAGHVDRGERIAFWLAER